MGISYKVTGSLKATLAKVAALPASEQDEIAGLITARISGDDWDEPWTSTPQTRIASLQAFVESILPRNDVARAITLVMGSFIIFVQAPMILLLGVSMIVDELTAEPSGAWQASQITVDDSNPSETSTDDSPAPGSEDHVGEGLRADVAAGPAAGPGNMAPPRIGGDDAHGAPDDGPDR